LRFFKTGFTCEQIQDWAARFLPCGSETSVSMLRNLEIPYWTLEDFWTTSIAEVLFWKGGLVEAR
jgi:hypothetical protein